jgi:hypothetical protein
MSHSTNIGFREPDCTPSASATCVISGSAPVAPGARLPPFTVRLSRANGVGHRAGCTHSRRFSGCFCPSRFGPERCFFIASGERGAMPSIVFGVGNNKNSFSAVRGIDADSRNNERLDGVATCFQVRYAAVEAHGLANKAAHIFDNGPRRPSSGNNAMHFRPEIAVIFNAALLPGL